MFLISYEDDDGNIKNIAGATNLTVAKSFIAAKMKERGASAIEDFEWITDEQERTLFVLGSSQYIIEPLISVS